jgi:hypothetical protein
VLGVYAIKSEVASFSAREIPRRFGRHISHMSATGRSLHNFPTGTGWWWADPAVAVLIPAVADTEAREA